MVVPILVLLHSKKTMLRLSLWAILKMESAVVSLRHLEMARYKVFIGATRNVEHQLKVKGYKSSSQSTRIDNHANLPPKDYRHCPYFPGQLLRMMDSPVNVPRFHMNNVKCCQLFCTFQGSMGIIGDPPLASHNSGVYRSLMTAHSPLTSRNPGEALKKRWPAAMECCLPQFFQTEVKKRSDIKWIKSGQGVY